MVLFLINIEIVLILFQIFFFSTLHVSRIAEETCPLCLRLDNLILESKDFDFNIKLVWYLFRHVIKKYDQKLSQIMWKRLQEIICGTV